MVDSWQLQLQTLGATITDGEAQNFGDPAAELAAAASSTVVADISHLGLIQVSGPDALTFLQGQLTQDVAKITGERAAYAGFCSPKGRLLAHFLVWNSGESYFLQLPRPLLEAIQKRLKMYVLRSKVTLADISQETIRFGLAGADAANIIAARFGRAPAQPMDVVSITAGTVVALPNRRFQIIVANDAVDLWQKLAQAARAVGAPAWRWLQIQAGSPEIYAATQEQFVPQMVNDDLLGAVSFQKGCYTGQEIVARLHYLGKAKRRMLDAHVDIQEAPQPGDPIYGDQLQGQAIGTVVDAAPAPQGGFDLLASIPVDANSAATGFYLNAPDGPVVHININNINWLMERH